MQKRGENLEREREGKMGNNKEQGKKDMKAGSLFFFSGVCYRLSWTSWKGTE